MIISAHNGDLARRMLDVVARVYAEVYAEPPYHEGPDDVADFRDSWERRTRAPGFQLVVARDHVGEIVGFSFGHNFTRDTRWWDGALTPLPAEATERPRTRSRSSRWRSGSRIGVKASPGNSMPRCWPTCEPIGSRCWHDRKPSQRKPRTEIGDIAPSARSGRGPTRPRMTRCGDRCCRCRAGRRPGHRRRIRFAKQRERPR
jgi:hypothetical protein